MNGIKLDSFTIDNDTLLRTSNHKKPTTREGLLGSFKCLIINLILCFILLCWYIYSKHNNSSMTIEYNTMQKEYEMIEIENLQNHNDLTETLKHKEEITTKHKEASNQLVELADNIDHFANEMSNTRNSLFVQREKTQQISTDLYDAFIKLNHESSISTKVFDNLNKLLFPFSAFRYEAQGKGYTSNIFRSLNEIRFIEEAMGYKLNGDCFTSLHSHLLSPNVFKRDCSINAPTLSLYLTERNNRFGGFTYLKWNGENGDDPVYDRNGFVFNLDSRKIWRTVPGKRTITVNSLNFPSFGEGDIQCEDFKNCTVNIHFNSFEANAIEKDYEINNGYKSFKVLSLEVYNLLALK